ncbi:hypothetical protein LWI28_007689 [Acer negundo]|uniref:Uncharacterized protein n=1 Tax=Acer negundo TaxID=4023 RepID=A0AAD5ICQ3_ACENE|nr:hypothetical protein LWI28_007689 [Acer negundo]
MKHRIETATELGHISEEIRREHNGFHEWDSVSSRRDHQTILQILIDGRDCEAVDIDGQPLPTLVYLAREKKPQFHHNFKAGAMNALVELAGLDSKGGPFYIGTGCFHRRDTLCGKKYSQECNKPDWKSCANDTKIEESREMGLMYGCLVEDIITGFRIQCRGWRSINFNPERKAFVGLAPTTLLQSLVQHKRWSEGHLQIFLSEYCPYLYGRIALFPKISSIWFVPFAYTFFANRAYSLGEFLWAGGTIKGWWHDQRMWVFKRTTSYLFGFTDNILRLLGFSKSAFVITAKVAEEDVYLEDSSKRSWNLVFLHQCLPF